MHDLELAPLWNALGEPKRRQIIQLLHDQPRTTSEISSQFEVSRFAIMRHLKVLEQAGLISTRREGRQRWNYLNEELFREIQRNYLEDDSDGGYQLRDILTFLAREERGRTVGDANLLNRPVQLEVELPAAPDRVFRALTDEIDLWWSYRIESDSRMHLEPHVGGRFYESFNGGGGALYALVTFIKPNEQIRLTGSMGLIEEEVSNIIKIAFEPVSLDSSLLSLSHRFIGRVSVITADTFKRSWVELLTQNLAGFIKEGSSYKAVF